MCAPIYKYSYINNVSVKKSINCDIVSVLRVIENGMLFFQL